MDWFETLDRAKALGSDYANNGIAGGQTAPEESPLSGEWAGAITPKDVVEQLGGDIALMEQYEVDDILSHWEDGYNSAPWPEENWALPTDKYNGRRVTWTDPDGGEEYPARIAAYNEGDETFELILNSGGEAEVPRTEVEFDD